MLQNMLPGMLLTFCALRTCQALSNWQHSNATADYPAIECGGAIFASLKQRCLERLLRAWPKLPPSLLKMVRADLLS